MTLSHDALLQALEAATVALPDPERPHTPGEYLGYVALRAHDAQQLIWRDRSTEAGRRLMTEIAALALAGLEENAVAVGLPAERRAAILALCLAQIRVPPQPGLGDYLLDIDGLVTRYKAHRPQLRGPDAAPRVGAVLLEVLATAIAALSDFT